MASKRERIVEHFKGLIDAGGVDAPPDLTVHRFPDRPLNADKLPAIAVYWRDEAPLEVTQSAIGRPLHWFAQIRIEVDRDGDDHAAPGPQLDPFYLWVVTQVMSDPTASGLAIRTNELGSVMDTIESDRLYAGLEVAFETEFDTTRGDPAV